MSIKITNAEKQVMKREILNQSFHTFMKFLIDMSYSRRWGIYTYSPVGISQAFTSVLEAEKKLKGVTISNGDYFWFDKDRNVIAANSNSFVNQAVDSLPVDSFPIDIDDVIEELKANPEIAEKYELPLAYVTEYSMFDFLDNHLHLLSKQAILDIIEKEILAKHELPAELVRNNSEDLASVLIKESNFKS